MVHNDLINKFIREQKEKIAQAQANKMLQNLEEEPEPRYSSNNLADDNNEIIDEYNKAFDKLMAENAQLKKALQQAQQEAQQVRENSADITTKPSKVNYRKINALQALASISQQFRR